MIQWFINPLNQSVAQTPNSDSETKNDINELPNSAHKRGARIGCTCLHFQLFASVDRCLNVANSLPMTIPIVRNIGKRCCVVAGVT